MSKKWWQYDLPDFRRTRWTIRGILLTPLIMLISIVTAGGGHGTPIPIMLCYPLLFLIKEFESGGGPLVWAVLLGQFPLYGLIIDLGTWTSRKFLGAGLVTLVHAALTVTVIIKRGFL